MDILGLIPARGGSKGIPQKNIVSLAGRPLLAYTADAALNSRFLNRTILSTDDEQIASVGKSLGIEVPFLRPSEFARDDSLAIDVVRHALEWLKTNEDFVPDAVMLLQPTSPLRRAEHIDAAIELMTVTGADSVVSVVEVPHQFNPVSIMQIEDGQLVPYVPGKQITRRQDKPPVFARNGPAVLLTRSDVITQQNELYGKHVRPFEMTPRDSIDIDEAADLDYVDFLLRQRQAA